MMRRRPSLPATGLAVSGIAGVAAVVAFLAAIASAAPMQSAGSVIDRTYSCASGFVGGLRQVEARAHSGSRVRSEWRKLPYAVIASGGLTRSDVVGPPENSVAWIAAGKPSLGTTLDDERRSFNARVGGTIGVNRDLCTPVSTRLPLTRRSLVGGAVGNRIAAFDCEVPRRMLVRVRAVVDGGTALRERGQVFRGTSAPASVARLSIATPAGRVVAYADVFDSGKARLFTARACTPD